MKRCPQCNRVESDDTLSFCRVDGATLVRNSGSSVEEAGTMRFDSAALPSEINTSILPNATTEPAFPRATAPTVSPSPSEPIAETRIRRKTSWWPAIVVVLGLSLVAALAAYLKWFRTTGNTDLPPIQSIAVMPFINASGNADVEYLSDGMTETLINGLTQLPNLSVKARSSVFRYKGKEVEPQTVGKELNVQAILNGRVVQRGDDLTLYLSLVDTRTGNQIWGEQYNRKQADLISLQNEIGRDVSSKLRTKLSGADEEKVAKNNTENAEAYQLYLQGRFFWNKRTPQNLQKSIEYFQEALNKDPNYALGYAGLSDAYTLLAYYGAAPAKEAFPKAKDAALKAVEIDDKLAESHNALGFILILSDYDYAGAEREYKRAIELNPNYAFAHQNLGVMLCRIGRQAEGMVEVRRALELDPFSTIVNRLYGDVLISARRYEDALAQLKKTLEMEPSFATTHLSLASVYQSTGKYAESAESYANYLQLSGRSQAAALARASFAAGGWEGYLREMTGPRRPEGLSHTMAGIYHAQLNQKDQAFAELEKAFENRESLMLYLTVDPRFDSLRDDPRYQELVRRMRFPATD
jgi:eukaryotic-like serine/threonine-protein kinase